MTSFIKILLGLMILKFIQRGVDNRTRIEKENQDKEQKKSKKINIKKNR